MPRNIQSTIKQFNFNHSSLTRILAAVLLTIGIFGQPTAAQASAADTVHYNIPQGSLEQALGLFSRQSGIALSSDADKIRDTTTGGLEGTYSVEMGLAVLLENSGFTFEKNAVGYVLVQASTNNVEPATTMPEVKVTGFMDPDSPGNPSYTRSNSSTATKSNLPIMKTPASVQVIPRAAIEDQQAIQVEDAIKNVSGVFPGFTFGGFAEEFMIRGFNTNFANYRDGFRFQAARLSLANIERVEVVKGAASNLYGRIEPGGMINLITKRPQAQSYYSLNQQFGSFGQYQTRADATGAINESGTLLYRINYEYLKKDSFRDFGFTERHFVAPSLTWKITPSTQFDLDFIYSNEKSREDYGIVAVGNRPARVPRSRFLGEPTQDRATQKLYNTAATLTHAFNDDWQVRARFSHLLADIDDPQTFGFDLNEVTGQLTRGFFRAVGDRNTYQGTVDVTGQFDTAGIKHNVLAGWEYYRRSGQFNSISIDANPINIFNPQYSPVNMQGVNNNFFSSSENEWNGVYFQNQITLFDKLHIMGGGRYDWATQSNGSAFGDDLSISDAKAAATKVSDARFNPRAGIVYQPWEWLSFYGNYVQSLGGANSAFDINGNTLQPQIGEQFEGGFKTSLFGGRLNSNVAYYHLNKKNLSLLVPGQPFSVAVGEARSRGVEVDISGQITNGLNIILTYAYTDAEATKRDNQGKRLWNVPKQSGSLWARYDMQNESLRGLSVGAGIYAQGRRAGDPANTFYLPSQARVDAMVRYRPPIAKSLSLQLNVHNLFNSNIYGGTLGDRFSLNVGAPRILIGSVQYTFQ